MRYAQIKSGQKLHYVYEPGEGVDAQHLTPADSLSFPLCGRKAYEGYRLNINVPMGMLCKNCKRVYKKRYGR